MKQQMKEYIVTNVFGNIGEKEHKRRINTAIKRLCVLDIEKSIESHYHANAQFDGGVQDSQKGGTL